ncbi:MAG: oligoendopeptidase F [Tissierellia bacterium]|nr:oligoendopeptidase F [Tissierellia bacterium]
MERKDIKLEYKWDLEKIFKDKLELQNSLALSENYLKELEQKKENLTNSAKDFYEFLKLVEKSSREISKIYAYAHMRSDEDTTDNENLETYQIARQLIARYDEKMSFFKPAILDMGEEKLQKFIEELDELKIYKHYFEDMLRETKHVLSKEEEAVIASLSPVLQGATNTYMTLENSDLQFPKVEIDGEKVQLSNANFVLHEQNPNREIRKNVYENYYKVFSDYANTIASIMDQEFKGHTALSKLRKYSSSREMFLSANNIPEKVHENLIEVINKNAPVLHGYMELRRKVLAFDKQYFYDIYMPIIPGFEKKYTYEEAKELVLEAIKPLGEEYVKIATEGLNSRWCDVYPNKGKRSGAYSSGVYDTQPYILLNFNGTIDDVFTLAHELGHSMHSYYTRNNQPFIYGRYSIFLAEIASTTNELLLLDHMMKNAKDENEKVFLLNHYVDSFRQTVFRQTMFAEFEHNAHKIIESGEPLTAKRLSEEYKRLNEAYYGDAIEVDQYISVEWARIPHFFMEYYVYQYATGFSSAVALSEKILNGDEKDRDNYLEFLKAGASDYPIEVLKKAGIDMTTKEPLDRAMEKFREVLSELEEKLA